MNHNNNKFEIKIDESKLVPALTLFQRLKNATIAVVLGGLLVQMCLFFVSVKSGAFTPSSIVIFYHNIYFIGYLTICAVIGWLKGQSFLDWLLFKIDSWKFW